jgi:large subunit ribosomal protein L25
VPEVRIQAEPRTEFGKGAARAIRRAHRVPAVMYGQGAENRHFTLPGHELMIALKTPNVLIRVEGIGKSALTLPKAVQRDAIRGELEHVDLIEVRRGEKVTVEIPVRVSGEVFSGGLLDQQLVQLAVEAEATAIPDGVDVDVEGMEIGTAIHAKDIALPEGTTLATDPEALVLHVLTAPTAEQIEAELAEAAPAPVAEEGAEEPAAEGEGGESAEGEPAGESAE